MAITNYSASDVLVELLVQAGQLARITSGQPVGDLWPGYAGLEPDKPDNVVTLYDTDASNSCRSYLSLVTDGPSGIQVRVRGTTHRVAFSKATEISNYLASVVRRGVSIGDKYYLVNGCTNIENVIALGKESPSSQRLVFVFNCYAELTDRGT